MKRPLMILLALILLLFVAACTSEQEPTSEPMVDETSDTVVEEQDADEPEPQLQPEEPTNCSVDADCEDDLLCIDQACGTIDDLYETDCEQKCNFDEVSVTTSNGLPITVTRGKGSYTAAGAVEWLTVRGPDYCPGSNPPVPLKLLKKDAGQLLSTEIVTLRVGETSPTITHPTARSVAFTFTVDDINEVCS